MKLGVLHLPREAVARSGALPAGSLRRNPGSAPAE